MNSYTRTNWEDSPSRSTPINADNLNHIEAGIEAATDGVTALETRATALESGKSDKATTIAGYGITDAYTKSDADKTFADLDYVNGELDNLDEAKADKADTYTKAQIDAALSGKLDDADGEIKTNHIEDGAVTTAKLGAKAVTGDKIANGAVSNTKISTNAITTNQIVDLNVTAAKLGNGAVTTAKIDDGAVTTAKIGDGAVTSGKLEGSLSAIINAKEISANKVTSMSDAVGAQDDARYPSVSAVRDWANSTFAAVDDMNDALDELDGQKADKSDTYTKADVKRILATGKEAYAYYVAQGQQNDNNDDIANSFSDKFKYLKTSESSDAAAQYLPTSDIDSVEVGAHDCTFTFRLYDENKAFISRHSRAANTTYVPASNVAYIKISAYRADGITEAQFRQWITVNRKSKLLELERRIAALEGSASTNSVNGLTLNTVENLQMGTDEFDIGELTVQPGGETD